MKKIEQILRSNGSHWVGDGFPVRSLFSYQGDTKATSPFLLFDYAGPHVFEPNIRSPRGVEQHPHRGFETVTIVYEGEVSHRDSSGGGGTISRGDVQWMTAGSGILHEEFHSENFSKSGGPFQMVQLWINLPAKDKSAPPAYQAIVSSQIPVVELEQGSARIIAGTFKGTEGAAQTFTPINLWDIRLETQANITLDLPQDHNVMIAVLSGTITVDGKSVTSAEIARLSTNGSDVTICTERDSTLLVMTGEPIAEPVVGYGPFVMNSEAEIREAINDFNSGRFGNF
ncbi:pirin family protein [Kiloniella laminariae]|uniref:pirin family protein n=1 Tax=Kiloniella laminariae TaxID=454162 RepID=UPI00037DEBFE|nr:pirin family protein [Kiloniella laminariae]